MSTTVADSSHEYRMLVMVAYLRKRNLPNAVAGCQKRPKSILLATRDVQYKQKYKEEQTKL